eukprot:1159776-Pelagomonas_calceolata.AAC.8
MQLLPLPKSRHARPSPPALTRLAAGAARPHRQTSSPVHHPPHLHTCTQGHPSSPALTRLVAGAARPRCQTCLQRPACRSPGAAR